MAKNKVSYTQGIFKEEKPSDEVVNRVDTTYYLYNKESPDSDNSFIEYSTSTQYPTSSPTIDVCDYSIGRYYKLIDEIRAVGNECIEETVDPNMDACIGQAAKGFSYACFDFNELGACSEDKIKEVLDEECYYFVNNLGELGEIYCASLDADIDNSQKECNDSVAKLDLLCNIFSSAPSLSPSEYPSSTPSHLPSLVPTDSPSLTPSHLPSLVPSNSPSYTAILRGDRASDDLQPKEAVIGFKGLNLEPMQVASIATGAVALFAIGAKFMGLDKKVVNTICNWRERLSQPENNSIAAQVALNRA